MLFCFYNLDRAGSGKLRQTLRPQHLDYLRAVADRIAFAGPLQEEDGSVVGSLLVIDFPDRAAAEAWLRDEPFTKGGVYDSVSIRGFVNRWPQKAGFPEPHS